MLQNREVIFLELDFLLLPLLVFQIIKTVDQHRASTAVHRFHVGLGIKSYTMRWTSQHRLNSFLRVRLLTVVLTRLPHRIQIGSRGSFGLCTLNESWDS